jgi:hypothetical protein
VTPKQDTEWRKSSYSGGTGGDCVELAWDERGLLTRDSKAPLSGMLSFTDEAASAFLTGVKAGRYGR